MEVRLKPNERVSPALFLLVIAAIFAVIFKAHSSDIQRGMTFVDGQRITAAQLHSLVDNATIVPGFLLNKSSATSLGTGDSILLYSASAGAFYKITAQTFLYGNTALITGEPEKIIPSTNDYLLIYDSTGAVLSKVSAGNLALNNTNLIAGQPLLAITNADLNMRFLVVNRGTNAQITLTNLFQLFTWIPPFTNLPVHTAPTNLDQVLLSTTADGTNYTNKRISLIALVTNLAPMTNTFAAGAAMTYTDQLEIVSFYNPTNPVLQHATVEQLGGTIMSRYGLATTNLIFKTWQSPEYLVTNAAITLSNYSAVDARIYNRWVLVCKTNEGGFTVGDEIDAGNLIDSGGAGSHPSYGSGASGLYIWYSFNVGGRIQVHARTNAATIITLTGLSGQWVPNWTLKGYAGGVFNNP